MKIPIHHRKNIRFKNVAIKEKQLSFFSLGDKLYDAGFFFIAFRIFLAGAQKGCRDCQMRLGHMYDDGVGIKSNIKRAIYWYNKSNKEGDMSASITNLFLIYRDINLKSIELKYMHRSALLGNEDAQREISNPKEDSQRTKKQKKNRIFKRRRSKKIIEKNKFVKYDIEQKPRTQ